MYDYHTHSSFSDDSSTPMEAMITRAIELGIKELAVTDHYDPGYADPDYPFELDFQPYHNALLNMEEAYRPQIKLVKGIELGILESELSACTATANNFPYDFIIGSFHSLPQEPIYGTDYSNIDKSAKLEEFYLCVHRCLKIYQDYDILGHVSIIDRYLGDDISYKPCMDIIEDILKTVIYHGKGIEINTSNFRYKMNVWLPRKEILKRYKELGGEILTFGSDAHEPSGLLDHFEEAKEMAKEIGFRYFTTFDQRNPKFLSI